jgi:hypothetical protein
MTDKPTTGDPTPLRAALDEYGAAMREFKYAKGERRRRAASTRWDQAKAKLDIALDAEREARPVPTCGLCWKPFSDESVTCSAWGHARPVPAGDEREERWRAALERFIHAQTCRASKHKPGTRPDCRTPVAAAMALLDVAGVALTPVPAGDERERLAALLHEMGDACAPFTTIHPVAMHNSQAAALLLMGVSLSPGEDRLREAAQAAVEHRDGAHGVTTFSCGLRFEDHLDDLRLLLTPTPKPDPTEDAS